MAEKPHNCLCITVDDEPWADYVVELAAIGTNWTYRKWNSGLIELWGKIDNQSFAITTSHGWGYISEMVYINFPQNLFVTYPCVTLSLDSTSYSNDYGAPLISMHERTPKGVGFVLFETVSATRSGVVNIYACGRWKEG
jgi:hypothetical protein